jgi:hypothetical protein
VLCPKCKTRIKPKGRARSSSGKKDADAGKAEKRRGVPIWVWIAGGATLSVLLVGGLVAAVIVIYAVTRVREAAAKGTTRENVASADPLITDLIHDAGKFKGKTLTVTLYVGSIVGTLRDRLGQEQGFFTFAGNAGLDLTVFLPKGLAVPDAKSGAKVKVTFVCKDGDLRHGNEAQEIVLAP